MNEIINNPVNDKLSNQELRKFAIVLSAAFVVIFGLFIPWLFSSGFPRWPWILAVALIGCAVFFPQRLNPVHKAWAKFGEFIHRIMNPLILGIVFFLLFLPLGFVMRKLKGDPMKRDLEPDADSYRISPENTPIEQMEKPF